MTITKETDIKDQPNNEMNKTIPCNFAVDTLALGEFLVDPLSPRYTYIHIYAYVCMYICIYELIYMYMCMYIFILIYVHIYRHVHMY
jgi:hypothetical protein